MQQASQEVLNLQRNQVIPYSTTVKVDINRAGDTSFAFDNNTELANKTIIGLFISWQDADNLGKSFDGTSLLDYEKMQRAFLTLHGCQRDFIPKAPLKMFNVEQKPLVYIPIFTQGLSLKNCYVTLSTSFANKPLQCVEITFIHL